jgi:signal transduction histidine kinase
MVVVTHRDETLRVSLANLAAKSQQFLDQDILAQSIAAAGINAGGYETQVWRRCADSQTRFFLAAHSVLHDDRSTFATSVVEVELDANTLRSLAEGRYLWGCGRGVNGESFGDLRSFIRKRSEAVFQSPMLRHLSLRPQAVAIHFPVRTWEHLWGVGVVCFDLSLRTLTTGQLETFSMFADFVNKQVQHAVAEHLQLELLQAVLHNARKPVNASINLAEWLKRVPPGDERDQITNTMTGLLKLASAKLQSLTTVWHHMEHRATHARRNRCNLVECVRDALNLFMPQARDSDVKLTLAAAVDTAIACTDPDVVQQILIELIDNSLTWFPRRTSNKQVLLELKPSTANAAWEISVHDNGSGFTQHSMDHAFQVKPSTRRGCGLGLPGVALFAESLGAKVEIQREPRFSPGASVVMTLPLGDECA